MYLLVSDHVLRLWEREWCTLFSIVMCDYCSGCLGSVNVSVRSSVLRFWDVDSEGKLIMYSVYDADMLRVLL